MTILLNKEKILKWAQSSPELCRLWLYWYQQKGLAFLPDFYLGERKSKTEEKFPKSQKVSSKCYEEFAPLAPSHPLFASRSDGNDALSSDVHQELRNLLEALKEKPVLEISKGAQNLVFSRGDPFSPLMFVGEAPGAEEDRVGKPFVGASGQLLDRMLEAIDQDPKKIYITNVVYWRPPFNRTPSPSEIEACLPFLQKHIQIIRPKCLVCLGAVAYRALFPSLSKNLTLTQAHDVILAYDVEKGYGDQANALQGSRVSIPAYVMYHPAFLLRSPGQKKTAWLQLQKIQNQLQKS